MMPFTLLLSMQMELIRQTLALSTAMTESLVRDQQRLMAGWSMVPFPAVANAGACMPFRLR